jgi:hypothetical protein
MYDLMLSQALTGVNARLRRMQYYRTPFITLDSTIQTPDMPMMVDYPPCPVGYGMEHLIPPNRRILRGFPCLIQSLNPRLSTGDSFLLTFFPMSFISATIFVNSLNLLIA